MVKALKTALSHYACGFVMGSADIIPGVSGGTMAWVLGIYERLINAISSFGTPLLSLLRQRQWREIGRCVDIGFVLALGAGILSAIVIMVKLVGLPQLMREHPEPVYGLFFGLISGSVWLLLRHPVSLRHRHVYLLIGALCGLAVVNLVPTATPDSMLILFLCGMVAISAMLLPGISGSFILLILGKYIVVLEAISAASAQVLIPFMLGCVCGLMLFSRLLRWLLKRYHDAMLWLMGGLLTGTLWAIWPFQDRMFVTIRGKEKLLSSTPILPAEMNTDTWLALGMAIVGFGLVVVLERFKTRS